MAVNCFEIVAMRRRNEDDWATMAIVLMILTESTYPFSVACFKQLSRELATPNFTPTNAQKVILNQALRLLDLELSFKAAEHPHLVASIEESLASDC